MGPFSALIARYQYAIPPYYLSLIDWSNPADPIRKQCVPDLRELTFSMPDSEEDPLREEEHMAVPGLIHRYPDRVLAMITSRCAMYCRHCNRKRTWNRGRPRGEGPDLGRMVQYVAGNPGIREVIVSGGDPLLVNPRVLDGFLGALRRLSHVEVLRIGTRVPVVLPMRITSKLCRMLAGHRPLWINTQFNHPREITPESAAACDRLLLAGLPVSNQAVLLKGVNDRFDVLRNLFQGLQSIMVRPYYLFHCEPVRGVEYFRSDLSAGIGIMEALWGRTAGLCIPHYVVDLPKGGGKARVMPSFLLSLEGEEAVFRTFEGKIVRCGFPLGESA